MDAEICEDIGDNLVALQRVARETRERDLAAVESYILVPEGGGGPIFFN